MAQSRFIPKSKYPNHTKAQIAAMLKNPRYCGKTIIDEEGKIAREPGFFCDK